MPTARSGRRSRRSTSAYESGERTEIIRGNTSFHLALARVSGSRWIPQLLRPMLETSERFSAFVIGEDHGVVYEVEQRGHAAIVAACRAGDADAAQAALAEHIKVFADIFLRDLAAGQRLTPAGTAIRLTIPGRLGNASFAENVLADLPVLGERQIGEVLEVARDGEVREPRSSAQAVELLRGERYAGRRTRRTP